MKTHKKFIVMKTRIFQLILIVPVLLLFVRCSEDGFFSLTQPNPLAKSPLEYWQTTEDALYGVNAIYNAAQGFAHGEGTQVLRNGGADDVIMVDLGDKNWLDVHLYNATPATSNGIDAFWGIAYTTIFRANYFLENVGSVPDLDDALESRLIGEAKFLRGYAYFHLVHLFGNVPLITTTPKETEDFFPEQVPPGDIWAQVESDLRDAQAALPDDYKQSHEDLGRATSGAATAYLGKALLYQQKWSDAASEFAKIMDGRYALVDDFSWNFDETHEFNAESVFEITAESESGLGLGNLMANTFGMRTPYADRSMYSPTTWFFELFKEEKQAGGAYDKRLPLTFYFTDALNPGPWVYIDPSTGISDTLAPDEIYYRKYADFEQIPIATRAQNNLREMRYADVLLMFAEAMVEGNQLTAAATSALNQVRNRAGLENFEGSTQAELREEIRKQRLLEFSLEGSRRDDLIRWGILDSQLETVFGPGTPDEDEERYIYITQDDYIFPIPQKEIDVNTKLEQNSGY
jgi:hypothetical protein